MEGVESELLAGVWGPGLAAVEHRTYIINITKRAEHAGLVHLHFGTDGQHGVVPDPFSETC